MPDEPIFELTPVEEAPSLFDPNRVQPIYYGDTPPAPPAAGTYVGEKVVHRNGAQYPMSLYATGEPYVYVVRDHTDAPGFDSFWRLPVTSTGQEPPSEADSAAQAAAAHALRAAILT